MDRFTLTVTARTYVLDTGSIITGPPIGTATFNTRDTTKIPHCTA